MMSVFRMSSSFVAAILLQVLPDVRHVDKKRPKKKFSALVPEAIQLDSNNMLDKKCEYKLTRGTICTNNNNELCERRCLPHNTLSITTLSSLLNQIR
jgi:hypothetical protein